MRLQTRLNWPSWVLLAVLSGAFFFAAPQQSAAEFAPELQQALDSSKYVYIQSERKSGELGAQAEIWFMHHAGAVWVASQDSTYRAGRIQAGRTKARVWIGSQEGPSFEASGSIVEDAAVDEMLFARFAEQYADGWPKFEESFRTGLAEGGDYVLIKYTPVAAASALSADMQQALASSTYVYIQSERKSGEFGAQAEIWFFHHDGAVWVGTPVSTHRVKRIQAGRTAAKIWIGSRDGPAFDATGSLVQDESVNELMYKTFAQKYAAGWSAHEDRFRSGFADGSRTLVRYDPAGM